MAMTTQQTSTSFSASSTLQWKYDVFLSFRGEDTRKGFTDHLYTALVQQGIVTFKDDPELPKGRSIAPELLTAIEESRFALIILSRNYASSTWCLDELLKILECMEARQTVMPVFYDVDPSNVQKQTGSFAEAFIGHEKKFWDDTEKVQRWRSALTKVANFSGWNSNDCYQSKLIKDIIEVIWTKLGRTLFSSMENLVGIDSRLEPINMHLGAGEDDVRFIGIWGMGGIGKTTVTKVVYERISHEFEVSFLLTNVRNSVEKSGLVNLQKQLLSGIWMKKDVILDLDQGATIISRFLCHKKVLLILDDVNHLDHLKYLAGNQKWFGLGSRVLITTRNEHLLVEHGVERRLKVEGLHNDEALQLFSLSAFKKNYPEQNYLVLSERVVNYASGLPLPLKVLGSFLCGRSLSEWNNTLSKLGKVCNSEIFNILKISYDCLEEDVKTMFLDIACFFNGEDKDRVVKILTSCDLSAIIGIKVLVERSLLNILHGRVWMHDSLQEMGWEIVRQESPIEPGRRSRLWLHEDVNYVLSTSTGTNAIEGIFSHLTDEQGVKMDANAKSFLTMNRLRYLEINNVDLPNGLEYLPNSLRILKWTGYPLKSFPSHLNLEKLLELDMCHSCIKHFHSGIKPLYSLKTINLSHSLNLVITPDFRGMPYVELLILEGCTQLYKVDPSIQVLERLTLMNLKYCKNLVRLPSSVHGLKSLKVLNLSGCSKLDKLPDDLGHVECLEELDVSGTAIRGLPSSIGMLEGLTLMKLKDCKYLVCLPVSVYSLKSLRVLNLSGCSKLDKLPDELGHVECLEELDVSGTAIRELPSSIGMLKGLTLMKLKDCKYLVCIPRSVHSLKSLKVLNLSGCSKLEKLPDELGHVDGLEELDVSGTATRELPSSIGMLKGLCLLNLGDCKNLVALPTSIHSLKSLKVLNLSGCSELDKLPQELGHVECLEELDVSGTAIRELPYSIGMLEGLSLLNLGDCKNLVGFPSSVQGLKSVEVLNLSGYSKFEKLPNELGHAECLEELDMSETTKRELPSSIGSFGKSEDSISHGCEVVRGSFGSMKSVNTEPMSFQLPLSGLCSLTCLNLSNCNLGEQVFPNDIICLPSLVELNLSGNNFVSLPSSIRSLFRLKRINLENCTRLQELSGLPSNSELFVRANGCASLEMMLDATNFNKLEKSYFYFINCFNINDNIAFEMLKTFLHQGITNARETFRIVIPGGEIPEWFSHQSVGNSVSVKLHPDWNNSGFIGYALCAVFGFHDNHQFDHQFEIFNAAHYLVCYLKPDGIEPTSGTFPAFHFSEVFYQVKSDHLWLFYISRDGECFGTEWHTSCCEIEFLFETCGPGLKVKKCGVHLIYEQDVSELDLMRQSSSSISPETLRQRQSNVRISEEFDNTSAAAASISASGSINSTRRDIEQYDDDGWCLPAQQLSLFLFGRIRHCLGF